MMNQSNKCQIRTIHLRVLPILICSLLLHHYHHISAVTGQSPPADRISLDCGSSSYTNTARDQYRWIGDTNSNISLFEPQINSSSVATTSQPLPSAVDPVPYSTARLSHSQFIYAFKVTPGQKFIRLHFYSSSYSNFDRSNAFFSVKANSYTLLSNFSASLNADAQRSHVISREFCVNIEENQGLLNLTFAPTPDFSDGYAFINGIEVVSMPTNLYYSAGESPGLNYLGQNSQIRIENNTALETVYRINVGGGFVSPNEDTGMFRIWDTEDEYLTEPGTSVLPANTSIVLNFSRIPAYSAPNKVYTSARSMGQNGSLNYGYNLTWSFPVDSGFPYLVRLHFCEFEIEVQKMFDRMFLIFIANLTAEDQADVIKWSGGNGIPVYRDYVVLISHKGNQKKQNLSIALYPGPAWLTKHSDAILNGLEIFKLSGEGSLAGLNPDPVPMSPPEVESPSHQTKPKNKLGTVLAIVGGAVSGVVTLSILFLLIFRRRHRSNKEAAGSSDDASWWDPFSSKTATTKSSMSHASSLPCDLCRYFSLAEIKAATNNFDNVFIVGVGGFGNVYKGFIDGGATPVAIKRLNPESKQGAQEFMTEIEMLSQLRHLYLVSLIGYCNEDHEMILVYDYMARGTLRDHLYNTDNPPLTWNQRLEICIGAARGLQYLHRGAKHTVIHRDVKTTNILLDDKWVAKVSDFGLSKMGPTSESKAHVSTVVKGSFGYLDPEYYRRQQLTEKSDVYSFGVVLCEVLSAKPPIDRAVDKKPKSLVVWARQCYNQGSLDQMVDPHLKGKIAPECLKKFAEVAMSCLLDNGIERPSMSDVVWRLEFALQLQKEIEIVDGIDVVEMKRDEGAPLMDDSGDVFSSIGEHVLDSKSITTVTTTTTSDGTSFGGKGSDTLMSFKTEAVFSEILNPQAR